MKHLIALIQDHKLVETNHALHGVEGLTGMTAMSVRGFGRTRRGAETHPTIGEEMELLSRRTRLDVFCSDDRVAVIVETIRRAAHTGRRGDGKVYVAPVEDALRIETGDRGEQAV